MHGKEPFKKKIEAEIRGVRVKLLELQTKAKNEESHLGTKHVRQLNIIEQQIEDAASKLRSLDMVEDHSWEQLRDDIENAWSALQDSLEDAISTFEGKH